MGEKGLGILLIMLITFFGMMYGIASCDAPTEIQTHIRRLPKGQRLISVVYKGTDMYCLTESMDSNYIPKNKIFSDSLDSYGVNEKIKFIETK
jgi:hypothetical protein